MYRSLLVELAPALLVLLIPAAAAIYIHVTRTRRAQHRCVSCGQPLPPGRTLDICSHCGTRR